MNNSVQAAMIANSVINHGVKSPSARKSDTREFDFEAHADQNQLELNTKFPATHYLSSRRSVCNTMLWITLFRRNLHRFVIDYLGIKLYPYQVVLLYYLGIGQTVVIPAGRATAKSFIIALYVCCRAILYPRSKIVIGSGLVKQSKLIITDKIENELCEMSPVLKREIASIKSSNNEARVTFHNGSYIVVVNMRGPRSNVAIREESFYMKESFAFEVLGPMQVNWIPPYCSMSEYENNDDLIIKAQDLYISSVGLDNGHWMWRVIDSNIKDMLNGRDHYVFAFDESITLGHKIKDRETLIGYMRTMDPISFRLEYKNRRIKENTAAFFSYSMLTKNQIGKKPFYPRKSEDVLTRKQITAKSNPFFIPKQDGEIRVVSCDFAFVNRKGNDNSSFSCFRALPESTRHKGADRDVEVKRGYMRSVPYLEASPGADTARQALRVRQLYEDFDADYLVLDLRNSGIAIYDLLAKIMYDNERDVEYAPFTCMNDDIIAARIQSAGARPVIYAITASQKLNSEIALNFRESLSTGRISFLPNLKIAQDEILSNYSGYVRGTPDEQMEFEKPFIETQLMIAETAGLIYEKKEQTGAIVVSEQGDNTKDRYTSVSYGDYFISLLERDLLSEDDDDIEYTTPCVSEVSF
jgi:hypothetical protein